MPPFNSEDTGDRRVNPRFTKEQLEKLHAYGSMSAEDFESHKRLLEQEPHITAYFSRRQAWALVFGSLQKTATWVAATIGGIWLGMDKIKAVFAFIAEWVARG